SVNTCAQNEGEKEKLKLPFKTKKKYADELFAVGNYFDAIDRYEELQEQKAENYFTFQLGQCYLQARDYKKAEQYFRKTVDADLSSYPSAQYYLGKMLQHQERYDEAKNAFGKFVSLSVSGDDKALQDKAKRQIEACDFAGAAKAKPNTFDISHIPADLNKPYTEASPAVVNGKMFYASLNTDSILNGALFGNRMYLSHIYEAGGAPGNWTQGKPLPMPVNSDKEHSSNPAFSEDGKRMYFTRCTDNGERNITCRILMTRFDNGKWSTPIELNKEVNAPGSSNT